MDYNEVEMRDGMEMACAYGQHYDILTDKSMDLIVDDE